MKQRNLQKRNSETSVIKLLALKDKAYNEIFLDTVHSMTLEEYALYYAELGFAVFPLIPDTKIPFKGSGGLHDATTDERIIQDWWLQEPDANIGLSTQNLVVVDIDQPNHPWLTEKIFPECPINLTPRKNGRR